MKTLLLIPLFALISGCTSSDNACSSSSNVNNAECQKQITDVDSRALTLAVNFVDSFFFDQNTQSWKTISKNNLEGGLMGFTVPIYSDFLNISTRSAMSKIVLASDQNQHQGSYATSEFNRIPYIEVSVEDGVEYIFDYTKTDLNNNIAYQKQGSLVIQDGRAFLPLINETFDSQFFASSSNSTTRYTHSISIAAQSKDKKGTRTTSIVFEAVLQIPNTDFYVSYANDTKNFNLKNRWSNYYKNSDGVPNTDFHFITLNEIKDVSEQIPLDLKITFQEPPSVKIIQDVFLEVPFDINEISSTYKVNPQRGYNFYVQRQTMTGTVPTPLGIGPDFQMKLKLNGTNLTLSSGREATISLAAGVPWNIDVFYDFTQHANYSNPNGTGLLTPLRPVCQADKNENFSPLAESTAKSTSISSGGFLSICHPTENRKLIIPSSQITTTPYALSDTWYDYFSYVPYDLFKREVGHFYGIRSVTLRMEGCVKISVRDANTGNYVTKSETHPVCNIPGGGDNQGWVYFFAEKQATLFDNMNDFEGVAGLKALMQSFGSRPIKSTPYFLFNGTDLNPTRKIY